MSAYDNGRGPQGKRRTWDEDVPAGRRRGSRGLGIDHQEADATTSSTRRNSKQNGQQFPRVNERKRMGGERLHQSDSNIRWDDDCRTIDDPVVPDYLSTDEILHPPLRQVSPKRLSKQSRSSWLQKETLHLSDSNIRSEVEALAADDNLVPDYLSADEMFLRPPICTERNSQQNRSSFQPKKAIDDDPWGVGSLFTMMEAVVESVLAIANLVFGYRDGETEEDNAKSDDKTIGSLQQQKSEVRDYNRTVRQRTESTSKPQRRKSSGDVDHYNGFESIRPPSVEGLRGFMTGERQQCFRGVGSSHQNGNNRHAVSHGTRRKSTGNVMLYGSNLDSFVLSSCGSGESFRRSSGESFRRSSKDQYKQIVQSRSLGDRDIRKFDSFVDSNKGQLDARCSKRNSEKRPDITNSNTRRKSLMNADNEARRTCTTQPSTRLDNGESCRTRRHSQGSLMGARPSKKSIIRSFDEDRLSTERHELSWGNHLSSRHSMNNSTLHPRTSVADDDDLVDLNRLEIRRRSSTMSSNGTDSRRSSHKSGPLRRAQSSVTLNKTTNNASLGLAGDDESLASGSWSCSHSLSLHTGQVSETEISQSDVTSLCIDSPTCAALLAKQEQPRRSSEILNQSGSLSVSHLDLLNDTAEESSALERTTTSFEVDCRKNAGRPITVTTLSPMIHGLVEQAVEASQPKQERRMEGRSKSRKDLFAESNTHDDSVAYILRNRRLRGSFLQLNSESGLVPK